MKKITQKMAGLRWAFKYGSWQPNKEEWIQAGRCIQKEENDRIARFFFKRDSKSAMAGRLLIRKAISQELNISYNDINLARTDKGKPYLVNEGAEFEKLSFNVSHQGQFAVLGAETSCLVGVDVMKVDRPGGVDKISKFFATMNRQFTQEEWKHIKHPNTEIDQLATFYRFWCLKESYVKAVGIGIGFELKRIQFEPKVPAVDMQPGKYINSTKVYVDEKLLRNWTFEETKLDDNHFVAVALQRQEKDSSDISKFDILSFSDLISSAIPQNEPDPEYWINFSEKAENPSGLS